MIPVRAHGTAAAQGAIHPARYADGQAAEAAGECGAVICLDNQMEMVVLYAEMDEVKAVVR